MDRKRLEQELAEAERELDSAQQAVGRALSPWARVPDVKSLNGARAGNSEDEFAGC
jgi:hypothetical protein